jgi:hypothetical protein
MRVKSKLIVCLSLCLSACGGGQKPAEEPAADSSSSDKAKEAGEDSGSDKAEAKSDDAESKDSAKSDKKDSAKKDSAKKDKEEDSSTSGPKITRTARDILTAPDVIFMFSFNQSDIKQEFEKQCDKEANDNPKKRADCMTKAKKKIDFDGIAFKQEKGSWYWLTISRKGKVLTNLHKVPIDFGKEDEHSIVVKPNGKDEGKLRTGAPGETKIEVPNEYEISIKDPKLGKMVFEAKIGLTDK